MKDPRPAPPSQRRSGIYLLPNLFTTGALFTGFYSIISALGQHYRMACVAIFLAMLLDSLDGRVARLTNTQSAFGAQYDSLSDMVAFGVAPALIMYFWSLHQWGKLGWLIAFIYVAGTALRLARFNTQLNHLDKRYFQGLPCPSAAAVVISLIWVSKSLSLDPTMTGLVIVNSCFTIIMGLLMVSQMRYSSFKELDMKGRVSFFVVLVAVAVFVAIAIDPPEILFLIFTGYALSGPFLTLWTLKKKRALRLLKIKQRRNRDS